MITIKEYAIDIILQHRECAADTIDALTNAGLIITKKDLLKMINGTSPSMEILKELIDTNYVIYYGKSGTWSWNEYRLDKLDEDELLKLYNRIK